MIYQRTLAKEVSVTGRGLHSGKLVTMKLMPAESNFGIQFKRTDLKNAPVIKATFDNVSATENATTIGTGQNVVHTVEHFLGVLYGLGVNNIFCQINGPEVPIMDGSGGSFAFLLKEIGIAPLNCSKKFIVITEPVRVAVDDKWAQIEPAPKLIIDSTIVFAHPKIKTQNRRFEFSCENFISDICRARTFGFLRDVDYLKRRGLIKGGSLDNAIILDEFNVVNPEGVRFVDEFIRHKILDTIGDISLMGHDVAGKITCFKSGHQLHNLLCKKIFATPSSYRIESSSSLQDEAIRAFELPRNMSPVVY